jgi:hypothetical protein
MLGAGMIPLKLAGGRYRPDVPEVQPPPQRHTRMPGTVPAWSAMTAGELAQALGPDTAHQAHGKWRLRCPVHRGERRDSLCIAKGDDQSIVWSAMPAARKTTSRARSRR